MKSLRTMSRRFEATGVGTLASCEEEAVWERTVPGLNGHHRRLPESARIRPGMFQGQKNFVGGCQIRRAFVESARPQTEGNAGNRGEPARRPDNTGVVSAGGRRFEMGML